MSAKAARRAVRERLADTRIAVKYQRMLALQSSRSIRLAALQVRRFRRCEHDRGVGWIADAMREHTNSTALVERTETTR